jgi:hypothetical protein
MALALRGTVLGLASLEIIAVSLVKLAVFITIGLIFPGEGVVTTTFGLEAGAAFCFSAIKTHASQLMPFCQ